MNDTTDDLGLSGEETLTHEISDEMVEAAARGKRAPGGDATYSIISPFCV